MRIKEIAAVRVRYGYRRIHVKDVAAQLQQGLLPAITTLRAIVTDGKADIRARVASARALLEYGIKYSELSDAYTQQEGKEDIGENLYEAVVKAVRGEQVGRRPPLQGR